MASQSPKRVLVLGAGLSSTLMIRYLLEHGQRSRSFAVRVGDAVLANAQKKVGSSPVGSAFELHANDKSQIVKEVQNADFVISMLPVSFHSTVVRACLDAKRPMLTASYVSQEIMAFDEEARKAGLLIMMECGVDPGIDHMATMDSLDSLGIAGHAKSGNSGVNLLSYESFTGGLVAPESDDGPWNYKFTWNPRNVVVAGQGTSMYVRDNMLKIISYSQLFRRLDRFNVPGYGAFDGYANRDSLKYKDIYGLGNIPTLLRGTLRRPGYCEGWDIFVQLGMTDDSYVLKGSKNMSYGDFVETFLPPSSDSVRSSGTLEKRLASTLNLELSSDVMNRLRWLGIFDYRTPIPRADDSTPAQILQTLLESKWVMKPADKDMLVMINRYVYESPKRPHKKIQRESSLVVIGDDAVSTAMAKTVGYPVAIVAKLILSGSLSHLIGIHRPTHPEIYKPVLAELATLGIRFEHRELDYVPS